MILRGQSICRRCLQNNLILPFNERERYDGMPYGLSVTG